MHLICFNQYVDSTPDNHLDSSMFGKHNSVTNDTNKWTVNLELEHYNTLNTCKLELQYIVVLLRLQALWDVLG